MKVLPHRNALWLVGAAAAVLLCALPFAAITLLLRAVIGLVLLLLLAGAADLLLSARAWRRSLPQLQRVLPQAFAIGVRQTVGIQLTVAGHLPWRLQCIDHGAAILGASRTPMHFVALPQAVTSVNYRVQPIARGGAWFEPAELRVATRWRLGWMQCRLGAREFRRVYPDFAQMARYAWLSGDRRLAEMGIKNWQRRGLGTDFKQLTEYRPGDELRRIDWKATLRSPRIIVREYQDECDQQVVLLLDCGRRMRAAEQETHSHFDAVLNAVVLLSYVALKQGDAVGVQTFAVPPGSERFLTPGKGTHALNHLMTALYDLQPTLAQPDYLAAATAFMRRQQRRALVVLVTNFRDEDSDELQQALKLLRTRHLVMLASLREQVLRQMTLQPMDTAAATLQVAGAHLFEQGRTQAFRRLAARDALMVDAEPAALGVELVNRYQAAKRAGVI